MPVPMVANFRGAGTGRWEGRGAKVFLQILTDQLTPTWTRWGRLCPPKSLLALQIFKPSDIPVNFIFLSRFTILSTYHYLFFFFSFLFQVLSRNYKKLFLGDLEEWKMEKKKGLYHDSRSWAHTTFSFLKFLILFF